MPVEVFGQNRFAPIGEAPYTLTLAPYGFFWFALEAESTAAAGADGPSQLAGSWPDVLRRRAALGRAIGRWLPGRRWFVGKGAVLRDLAVEDVVELSGSVALAVVRTSFTEGDDHLYSVPMLHTTAGHAEELEQRRPGSVIALLDDGAVVDAMNVPEGAGVVAGSALRRRTRRGRSSVAIGHPRRPGFTKLAADPHDVHVLSAEQTNSSAIVGGRVIAKLIRRLTPGENPDVTLPMHLLSRGFDHVPGVAGTLDLQLGRDAASNAVVVHDVVANEADLWEWSQDLLTREVERLVSEPESTADDAVMAAVTGLLAERTAEMHLGLAGGTPGFEPEPFSLLWQRSMLQSLRASLRETQRLVRRSRSSLAEQDAALAAVVLDDGDRLLHVFDVLRTRKLDARRIRVHGDLHLGQALWTGHDVVFIDFEGEPGRPIGERSIKRSPLNDVGGIVRSIDYAGRVALATSRERGRVGETQEEPLERWRRAWTDRMTAVYVNGYLETLTATPEGAGLVPADVADVRLLLDAHVLLKALYEVRYELTVRPAWVSWPLAAISQMLYR